MDKIDKILLHIPIIGFLLMMTIMGSKNKVYIDIKYEETRIPLLIQGISILLLIILGIFLN